MSNKENNNSYLLRNTSPTSRAHMKIPERDDGVNYYKPVLPHKVGRKRNSSQSVLSSIKNVIWPSTIKRARSDTMGSVCMKSHAEPSIRSSQLKSPRRFAAKVAPCIDEDVEEHNNHIDAKNMFYVNHPASEEEEKENMDNNTNVESDEVFPEVFSDIENGDEVVKESVQESVVNHDDPDLASSSVTTIEFTAPNFSTEAQNQQRSLPNLRSHLNSSAKPRKRFSQSETLKPCNGSTNLLDAKQVFSEYRGRPLSKSTIEENQQTTETKRKKRLPTIENGVHVLENDKVNYYQVLEEIGRGSFGSVCKCKSHKDNKCYAMKIISKKRLVRKNRQLSRKPGSRSNPLEPLHCEVAILKKMDHPNVVKLIEVIDDVEVDNFYMIFELMDKGVVIDIPTDDPIPEERSRRLFRDLLLGIEYCHYSKIIHRDIKPSNLLLDENDHVKIADFGVSNMFDGDNDLLNKYAGSPAFQAPEVLDYSAKDKYSGKAADIWAMGVTLYCFLYGKCPFFSENVMELSQMIKSDLVSFPDAPLVNPQVFDLISRMLSKEAKDRITMEEIKEHPWVTQGGEYLLPDTEEHCTVIEVTDEDVRNSIKIISKVSSLVIAKSILKAKSFLRNKQSKGAK